MQSVAYPRPAPSLLRGVLRLGFGSLRLISGVLPSVLGLISVIAALILLLLYCKSDDCPSNDWNVKHWFLCYKGNNR